MWLHEQEVIRLNRGLTVFRPAMTIRLANDRRQFTASDFAPLNMHYDEQTVQVHIMDRYAQAGLESMADALRLAMDYFVTGTGGVSQALAACSREASFPGRPLGSRGTRSWTPSGILISVASWWTTVRARMYWCSRAQAPARPGCWFIV